MSTNWSKLPNVEKEPYISKSTQLASQHNEDLEKWEMKMIDSGHFDIIRAKTIMKYMIDKNEHRNKY